MPRFILAYIRFVDALNHFVGRCVMYGIFVLMAILLWSSISKTFFLPSLWTLEAAQFVMVSYYILGSAWAMQRGSHVRMDLFYSRWSDRTRAWVDAITIFFLLFFLGILLYGGIESFLYSLEYNQRSRSAWRPYLWPIKLAICLGLVLMLLQAIAEFFKDVARLRGHAMAPAGKGDL